MPADFPPALNEISRAIIGAAIEVHTHLGPGLREKIYENALARELRRRGHEVQQQALFRVLYKGDEVGVQVIDMAVDRDVLVECKSALTITEIDKQQSLGYAKLANKPLALLINFNVARLVDGVVRRINWPLPSDRQAIAIRTKSAALASDHSPFPSAFSVPPL